MRTGLGTGNGKDASQVTASLPLPQGQPCVLRFHHPSNIRFVPKTSLCVLPEPRDKGLAWAGHPWGSRGRGVGAATHGFLSITYSSRKISTNFPNLLELSFLTVLALPKDSSKGVASRICHGDGESWGVSPGTQHTVGQL